MNICKLQEEISKVLPGHTIIHVGITPEELYNLYSISLKTTQEDMYYINTALTHLFLTEAFHPYMFVSLNVKAQYKQLTKETKTSDCIA